MYYQLFRKQKNMKPQFVFEVSFENPYEAFNALRELSYPMQEAGLKTRVAGTGDEPELFLSDDVSFVFTLKSDYGDERLTDDGLQ